IVDRLAGRVLDDLEFVTSDGLTLALTFEDMERGGSVVRADDITERRNAEERINQHARYDSLTGLPNRNLIRMQMEAALAEDDSGSAVLFVDLDHFKQVNDTLGHRYGDQLLIAVADRLKATARNTDTIARFGGDEFIV